VLDSQQRLLYLLNQQKTDMKVNEHSDMKITFVNHASFIIEYKNIRLICDPWLEGTAFDNGWGLLSETRLSYEEFKTITHIWFSHEHPDHFSPPCLSKIPLEYRRNIVILFQKTIDGKVLDFCRKLEFKSLLALEENQFHTIAEDFEILCNPFVDGDSYALFKTPQHRILNLNDCVINTKGNAARIASLVGPVDVLFTQFGYANKVGNTADTAQRKAASQEKLQRIRLQVEHLKPRGIVPFASFIYFCHEENSYMNDGMNDIGTVHHFIQNELHTPCMILYPGDTWNIDEIKDSQTAIQKYREDVKAISSHSLLRATTIDTEILKEAGKKFVTRLRESYPQMEKQLNTKAAGIYVTDHHQSFLFSGKEGLKEQNIPYDACDVALGSEALLYMLKHLWGGDTLNINARFQIPPKGDYTRFRAFGEIASALNRKIPYAQLFPSIPVKVIKKIKRLIT
jgi:UDP-MurNAc hydroxylase